MHATSTPFRVGDPYAQDKPRVPAGESALDPAVRAAQITAVMGRVNGKPVPRPFQVGDTVTLKDRRSTITGKIRHVYSDHDALLLEGGVIVNRRYVHLVEVAVSPPLLGSFTYVVAPAPQAQSAQPPLLPAPEQPLLLPAYAESAKRHGAIECDHFTSERALAEWSRFELHAAQMKGEVAYHQALDRLYDSLERLAKIYQIHGGTGEVRFWLGNHYRVYYPQGGYRMEHPDNPALNSGFEIRRTPVPKSFTKSMKVSA